MKLYYRIKNTIRDFRYNLRCRCQRFKRGYSYGDVWDMDIWFMNTVKPMLIHLRDHGCGIPSELYDEANDSREHWEDILTEMINCLDIMNETNAEESLGFCEAGDYKRMTISDHQRIWEIMDQNKNRFFELFSQYFYCLWD